MNERVIKIKRVSAALFANKRIIFTVAGAVAGYAYYFVEYSSGNNPVSFSPFMSIAFGAIAGLIISGGGCGRSCPPR